MFISFMFELKSEQLLKISKIGINIVVLVIRDKHVSLEDDKMICRTVK